MLKETKFLAQLNMEEPESSEIDLAFSSLNRNKEFATPIKFVFTDSFANANKQRVPVDEFINVINTGQNMPIKGYFTDGIPGGHTGAEILGTITHLKKENSTVMGLGLLWKEEKPDEVALIKQYYEEKKPINLSWELGYTESVFDSDGVEDLHGIIVRATTIVSDPAYEGRTPIFAVAQKNSSLEENKLEELQKQVEDLIARVQALESEVSLKDEKNMEMESQLATLKEENEALTSYKTEVEAQKQREQKLAEIKEKFSAAGVEKDEAYFVENADKLLAFEDSEIEFMLQNLISFASSSKTILAKVEIPNLTGESKTRDPKKLGEALRNLNK